MGTGEQEGEEGPVTRADGVSAAPEGVCASETRRVGLCFHENMRIY